MVDYQYLPDMNDPVAKLRLAMDRMDGMTHPFSSCELLRILPIQWTLSDHILFQLRKKTMSCHSIHYLWNWIPN
jgi:hypothetical protein